MYDMYKTVRQSTRLSSLSTVFRCALFGYPDDTSTRKGTTIYTCKCFNTCIVSTGTYIGDRNNTDDSDHTHDSEHH